MRTKSNCVGCWKSECVSCQLNSDWYDDSSYDDVFERMVEEGDDYYDRINY